MMKRLFDLFASLLALALLGWLVVILALWVRRDSPGPGIFAQPRVGRHGRIFTCYKLRTMSHGTPSAPSHETSAAAVTRLGSWLRRHKLDELPQLWNVLKGDMSFVGPRPCLPSQTLLIEERGRHSALDVLPGITGEAQVAGVDMSDPARLAAIDGHYARNRTFGGDLRLIGRTLTGSGRGDRVKA